MTPKVYWISNNSPGKLALVPRPRGNEWLEDEIAILIVRRRRRFFVIY